MISVAYAIPYIATRFGGPVVSLASIARGLAERGARVTILSSEAAGDGEAIRFDPRATLRVGNARPFFGYRRSPSLEPLINQSMDEGIDVLHSHGLWTDIHRRISHVATRRKIPHLISPCGMLATLALRRSRFKKLPAKWLFQDRALKNASCLHATSQRELEEIRSYGLVNPVAVIPLPVETDTATPDEKRLFSEHHGIESSHRYALFLGRVHPVKGLVNLIKAWAVAAAPHPEWRLLVAGPQEVRYRATLDELIQKLGLNGAVQFVGPVEGKGKWAAYQTAQLFIMPSQFENFGLAVAEAAWAGLPIVTTTGTPWKVIEERGGGWWLPGSVKDLAPALENVFTKDAGELARMGQKAHACVTTFTVPEISAKFMQLYEWMVARKARPSCVSCLNQGEK